MNRGWIKLYRRSLDSGILRNHNVWVLFTYCLLKASHKQRKAIIGNQEIILEPGQFIFGRRVAARETGLSEREVRTGLDILKNWKILTIKTTNRFSVITIVNWGTYQGGESEDDPQNDQQPANKVPQTRMYKKEKSIYILHHGNEKVLLEDGIKEVLELLNEKREKLVSKKLRPITSDKNIIARLKDGGSVYECCRIIVTKSQDKYFIDNPKYFHPDTLFRKAHWARYIDEAEMMRPGDE
ncbi:MAG: conserved phage C-terminal domain-containing protein [Deltaproteobacteria bacterium]|nr:conserved phage C-terminal domain-containing protein [Deltaproteobacteria bacterium]MBN2844654.1 conserved phage C-terminal domain-containing protein [Deltaproteobacteria bacterium]